MNGLVGRLLSWLGLLNADTQQASSAHGQFDAWSLYDTRQVRYEVMWSLYQNNTFWEQLYRWSPQLKTRFTLYKNMRTPFNPVHRLGEFHETHICGGALDPDAGDGTTVKSALPIDTKSAAVRSAIAKLWADSQWAIHKDDWVRKGAVLGDVGLFLCDEPDRGRVRMEVLHPGHVKWAERDSDGTITGYTREEWRYAPDGVPFQDQSPLIDPRSMKRVVRYNEECWLEGGRCHFRTYLNGGLFDWRTAPDGRALGKRSGAEPEWSVDYDFVPLVLTQHINVGLAFGMSEPHVLVTTLLEGNDVASNMGDQIRKVLNSPWAILAVSPPNPRAASLGAPPSPAIPAPVGNQPTMGNPQPGRTEQDWFYFPGEKADVKPMVAPMPLEEVGKHIDRLMAEIERTYPELRYYLMNELGDVSGRALRVARQATETKVQARRTAYDHSLARAQCMAMAIGSRRGYDGYPRGVESPDDPSIKHSIAHRPVFAPDPQDDIETDKMFWDMVAVAVSAGADLEWLLEEQGYSAESIKRLAAKKQAAADAAVDQVRQRMQLAGVNDAGDNPGGGE